MRKLRRRQITAHVTEEQYQDFVAMQQVSMWPTSSLIVQGLYALRDKYGSIWEKQAAIDKKVD